MKKNIKLTEKLKNKIIKNFFIFGVFLLMYFYHILFVILTLDSITTRLVSEINFNFSDTILFIIFNIVFVFIVKFINSKTMFSEKMFKENIIGLKEHIENYKKMEIK